ncbi:MAG: aspartate--tRNA ligase [Longimicrobiales bacterium]
MTDYSTTYRTRTTGSLRNEDAGATVRLAGWVHRRRDLGGLIFIDLRDRSGLVQLSFGPEIATADVLALAKQLGSEWVIAVSGTVRSRPAGNRNTDLDTGEIEVQVSTLTVLAESETPPILVARSATDELPAEELRLRYRYLDLRREELQRSLGVRHRMLQTTRRHLTDEGFWEIETPMLTRRTPEGARDYLVPSRVHPGEFYALPQSPQLYKQLLMASGYDRYFQIARCLRDEDLRADRQPEFTQIDAEMSFVDEEDVFRIGERLMGAIWKDVLGVELAAPWPRLSFDDALRLYGTDKPDLRFGMPFVDVTQLLQSADFRLFQATIESGERIRGVVAPGGAQLSRKELDELTPIAKSAGAEGALWIKRTEEGLAGQFAKALPAALATAFIDATGLGVGDLFVAVIGRFRGGAGPSASRERSAVLGGAEGALDVLRRHLGKRLALGAGNPHAFLWVTEFPMFDWNADEERAVAAHHPFTAPHAEDASKLIDYSRDGVPQGDRAFELYRMGLRSRAYDAVYNGNELASGSIRIHDSRLQRAVFSALGISESDAEARFGFLLEAFRYGAPPHGGFAFGFDRMVMLLVGASSLRDVIAFPKTTAARALFEGAPSAVDNDELRELHIRSTATGGV